MDIQSFAFIDVFVCIFVYPRNKEKSGSQPASLDHVLEKRFPLKAHQSESYLLIGMFCN